MNFRREWLRISVLLLAVVATAVLSIAPASAQQACRQPPKGVVGWWAGDDNPNDLVVPGNNALLVNGTTYAAGVVGDGFSFDGVNDRVDVADAPSLHLQRFTLAAWVRADVANQWACIICKQYGNGDADSFSLWLNNGILQGGSFLFGAEAVSPTAFPVNQFVHTAVTWDGSIERLYLDGKLIARAAGPTAALSYDANQVLIGAEDNGLNAYGAFFRGTIDEPQIFGRALSDCEIRTLADARSHAICRGDADGDLLPDFQDNCPSVANAGQQDTDTDSAGDACDCAVADPGVFSDPGDRDCLGFTSHDALDWCRDPSLAGASTTYDVVRGDLSALPVSTAGSSCRSLCLSPPSGLIAWWTGDATTTDLAGGNTATLENGATYGTGLVRSAFSFDGVDDRLHTANLTLGNSFTVAAWVNSDVVNQGSYHRILETSYATGFELGTDGTGTAYKLIVKNAAAPYGTVNGGTISPGNWQLVVGTYDGTTGTLYVDGRAVSSSAFVAPGTVNLPLYVGAYVGGGFGWNGLIDEVQIYNRTLTASEVASLYESGSAGECKVPLGGVNAPWTTPWAADLSIPAPGHGYWYLYRGHNACGVGSYGFRTGGAERVTTVCD